MSIDTRVYPEELEPRAIKIRQPSHKKRNTILFILAVLILLASLFAVYWFVFDHPYFPFDLTQISDKSLEENAKPAEGSSEPETEPEPAADAVVRTKPLPKPHPIAPKEPKTDPIPRNEWYMILVNRENPLPSDFSVETVSVDSFGHQADQRIVEDLNAMLEAGKEAGYHYSVSTAYRSFEKQDSLYKAKLQELLNAGFDQKTAEIAAEAAVAKAGTSEHNTGLALDIVPANDASSDASPEGKWLLEHATEYGFILRYPKEKEAVTGFSYEPWHFRYVGKEQAAKIADSGLCLEEYLAQ